MRASLSLLSARRLLCQAAVLLLWAPLMVSAQCTEAIAATDQLQALTGAESTARDALATVRRNAQDWKNLLLRGRDPAERLTMQARFDAQAQAYEARLVQLRMQLSQLGLGLERIDTLQSERAAMLGRYREVLARHGVATLEAAAAADRDAQGVDVTTFRILEQLIDTASDQTKAQFQTLRAAIASCSASTPRKEGT